MLHAHQAQADGFLGTGKVMLSLATWDCMYVRGVGKQLEKDWVPSDSSAAVEFGTRL